MTWLTEKISDWWDYNDFAILHIILASILFIVAFFIINAVQSTITQEHATIIEEKFSPDNQQTGSGLVLNPKGGISPIITHSGHGDEWFVVVRYQDGEFEKIQVSITEYYSIKSGDNVIVKKWIGRYLPITIHKKIII